ncbi:MAG: nucleotide exchange factor GrpE [Fimbriimonas sp.]|nr:nucleotide exchange factor GrpE [Fimbriimonas sp.]
MSSHKKQVTEPKEPIADEPATESSVEQIGDAVNVEVELLAQEIENLTAERDEAKDQVLRTLAELQNFQKEFQNYRRRNQQEMAQFRLLATEQLVSELLPVLDNFERTILHVEAGATVESLVGGIKAVERQLRNVLESQNVKRIPTVGQPFDPDVHEAIGTESGTEHPDETVVIEVEPGYKMGEKVIRPARVKVAKS